MVLRLFPPFGIENPFPMKIGPGMTMEASRA